MGTQLLHDKYQFTLSSSSLTEGKLSRWPLPSLGPEPNSLISRWMLLTHSFYKEPSPSKSKMAFSVRLTAENELQKTTLSTMRKRRD